MVAGELACEGVGNAWCEMFFWWVALWWLLSSRLMMSIEAAEVEGRVNFTLSFLLSMTTRQHQIHALLSDLSLKNIRTISRGSIDHLTIGNILHTDIGSFA